MDSVLITALITGVASGGLSAIATVAALKVHITWLRETVQRHERAIERAHQRIDRVELVIE